MPAPLNRILGNILAQAATSPTTAPDSGLGRLLHIFLHLGEYLNEHATAMGGWFYVVLFAIVFAETGLVILPFLPGDSLLFAVGSLCAQDNSTLNVWLMFFGLTAAAIIGDAVNYHIGKAVGPKVFHSESSRWLNRQHLVRAHEFYERYGGKAIILARFVPIVRTFAPFVAGIGTMNYARFLAYNVVGAIVWVGLLLGAGYAFGNIPWIKNNFSLVTIGIIIVSVLPLAWEWWAARRRANAA